MRQPLFDHVEQIRAEVKYFAVAQDRIERELASVGRCEVIAVHEFVDENGQQRAAELRLNMSGRVEYPHTWKVVLKLHKTRIDGIDFETKFTACDGTIGHGWHRHRWNRAEDSAEREKVPVRDFDSAYKRSQFLTRAMNTLRVRLSKSDDVETDDLRFD